MIVWSFFGAFAGTAAFAILFHVPLRLSLLSGLIGGAGWVVYAPMSARAPFAAAFCASAVVVLLSRWLAVRRECPSTVLMLPGIFPLVPGVGVYRTVYYLVTGDLALALHSGLSAVKTAVAIVLGIAIAFEFPEKLFGKRS